MWSSGQISELQLVYILSTGDSSSLANRKAQSHQEVLGGRLAATTSFTVNRMGKQQEEKLTGMTQVNSLMLCKAISYRKRMMFQPTYSILLLMSFPFLGCFFFASHIV